MIFFFSLCMTLCLSAFPFPASFANFLPSWALLFAVWWGLMRSYQLSMVALLIASLAFDVMYATALGLHGLLFAFVTYILAIIGPSIRQVNWVRQSAFVFVVLLMVSSISYWARNLTGAQAEFNTLALQVVITSLFWTPTRMFFDLIARISASTPGDR